LSRALKIASCLIFLGAADAVQDSTAQRSRDAEASGMMDS